MNTTTDSNKGEENKEPLKSPDFSSPDSNSDKTGSDCDADKTVKRNPSEKSKLEVLPDSTGIDTKADKTKQDKLIKQ